MFSTVGLGYDVFSFIFENKKYKNMQFYIVLVKCSSESTYFVFSVSGQRRRKTFKMSPCAAGC